MQGGHQVARCAQLCRRCGSTHIPSRERTRPVQRSAAGDYRQALQGRFRLLQKETAYSCTVTRAVLADSAGAEPSQRFKVVLNRRSIADLVYIVHISPHVAGFKRETSGIQPLLRQLFLLLPPWARIALAHKISLHIAGVETCPRFHTSSIAFMSGCYCNTSQVNKDPNKAAIAVARRRPHALRHLLSGTSQTRYSNVVMSTSIDT